MKSLYNFLNSKGQMASLILAIVCIAIVLGNIFGGLGSSNYDLGTDLVAILKDEESTQKFNFFNSAISVPIFLIGLAAFALVVFGIRSLISDPKGSLKFLLGAVLVVVLFFVFQSMSDANLTGKAVEIVSKDNLSDDTVKMIAGGIKTTVLMIGLAIGAAVVGGVVNLFK